MAKILLREYAQRLGKKPITASQRAARGAFKTTEKIGRDWFIEEDEPWLDNRLKSGKYVNYRYGYQHQKKRRELKRLAQEAEATPGGTDASE